MNIRRFQPLTLRPERGDTPMPNENNISLASSRSKPSPHLVTNPFVPALAWATRHFHPKGTDRLLRLIHPPGNRHPIQTILPYDLGLRLHIDTHSFCEWYIYFYGAFRPEISK